MLEIIALIYLCRKIGNLAEQKGQKRGLWQFLTVAAWVVAEIFGVIVGMLVLKTEELFPLLPFAYGFAIGSYFLVKAILSKKPDVAEASFEFEEQTQQ